MTYTHIFSVATKEVRPIEEAAEAVREVGFRALGFHLLDIERVKFDKHGMPSRDAGGWSYGHFRDGWICAGAGGLNSLPVVRL